MIDADLPPLPQLIPVASPVFTMRCMTDDALRELQREAFNAALWKAAVIAEKIRFAMPASPAERAFNTGVESAAKCIRAARDGAAAQPSPLPARSPVNTNQEQK